MIKQIQSIKNREFKIRREDTYTYRHISIHLPFLLFLSKFYDNWKCKLFRISKNIINRLDRRKKKYELYELGI